MPRGNLLGKGRYLVNVFVERLWRSVNYEVGYLKAYAGGHEVKAGNYADFCAYDTQRPHQALGYLTRLQFLARWQIQKREGNVSLIYWTSTLG
ncbi:MAG: integrase core domain-containing protein [Chloroflexota bacterium]